MLRKLKRRLMFRVIFAPNQRHLQGFSNCRDVRTLTLYQDHTCRFLILLIAGIRVKNPSKYRVGTRVLLLRAVVVQL